MRFPGCYRSAWLGFVVVDDLFLGQHALMQDTGNQNAAGFFAVEHHMPALLPAPQSGPHFSTGTAECRIVGQLLAAFFQFTDVVVGLRFAPDTKGINAAIAQVGLGPP